MRLRRLYLRIYLHAIAIAVVVAIACLVVPTLLVRSEWISEVDTLAGNFAGFVADLAGERWSDEAALDARVDQIAQEFKGDIAIYRLDGSVRHDSGEGTPCQPNALEVVKLARGQPVVRVRESMHHHHPAWIAAGIHAGGRLVGYVVVSSHKHDGPPLFVRPPFLLIVFLLVLLVAVIPLTRSITLPLERLTAVARAYGAGDLSARAETTRADEIGLLGRALADMASRVRKLLTREKELLANVSHELRSPLTRVRVALALAGEAVSDEQRSSALQGVEEDLAELEALIGDILAVSRLDLAALPLRLERLEVGTILGRVVEGAAGREATSGRRIVVALDGDRDAGFVVDPALLRRALDNLVDNAARYSPAESEIRLCALVAGAEIEFRVEDDGIGIAEEDQRRLFEPFFRADRSRTRATGGLGLGLVLTRRIVEAHGGSLRVESALGKGTRVTLVVPRARPPSAGQESGSVPAASDSQSARSGEARAALGPPVVDHSAASVVPSAR